MDAHDASLDLSGLPVLAGIRAEELWADLPLETVSSDIPVPDAYLDRHDRWTEKVRLVGLDAGVLVDYRLLPGLDRLVDRLYGPVGWARPDIFVVSDIGRKGIDGWSAVSVMNDKQPMILLGSHLVEALDVVELAFVIGHETGHLLGYTGAWRREMSASFLIREYVENDRVEVLRRLDPARNWTITYQAIMANARAMESRCDRLGLVLCGDLDRAAAALLTVTLRSSTLARGIALDRYLEVQLPLLSGSPEAHPLSINAGHPFVPYRLRCLAGFVEQGGLAWAHRTWAG